MSETLISVCKKHRVYFHEDCTVCALLSAAKDMESALGCCSDSEDWRINVMGPALSELRAAIAAAESPVEVKA